MFELKKKTHLV